MKKYFLVCLLFMSGCPVWAAAPTRVSNYTSGTTIRASDVMGNENPLYSYLQAGVDTYSDGSIVNADISGSASIAYSKLSLNNSILNADISSSAAIAYSKLNLATSILNADVSASAAIVDTKLATISTAGKVSGAALTSLSSTPSGAGVLPIANIATGTPDGTKFVRDDGTLQNVTVPITITNVDFESDGSTNVTISSSYNYMILWTFNSTTSPASIGLTTNGTVASKFNASSTTVPIPIETGAATNAVMARGTIFINYKNGNDTIINLDSNSWEEGGTGVTTVVGGLLDSDVTITTLTFSHEAVAGGYISVYRLSKS